MRKLLGIGCNKMKCNAFEYEKMCNRLFYGVALTDEHLTEAAKEIRDYILDGDALPIMNALEIGLRIKENPPGIIAGMWFQYIGGANAGRLLTVDEVKNIGLFFRGGAYYGILPLKKI